VADALAKHICTGQLSPDQDLLFVWSQTHCTRLRSNGSSRSPQFLKPLAKVWADERFGALFGPESTVIVDNSLEKVDSTLENAIIGSSFDLTIHASEPTPDAELCQNGALWAYFDRLSRAEGDVREFLMAEPYVRSSPFAQM